MRELKFRGWNKEDKIMVYDHEDGNANYWDGLRKTEVGVVNLMLSDEENYIWMQYTGLKDKNGKDIYENDIVRIDWNDVRYIPVINVVEWNNEMACFDFGSGATSEVNWSHEVIGNIHEHPDLIRKEK